MLTTAATQPQVIVDGQWLTNLAWWGDASISHRWPLGCWEASWSMPLKPYQRFRALRSRAPVEIRIGAAPIWAGSLSEPDWAEGKFTALGACREAEEAACLTAGGLTTSVPDTAVDQAIARGAVSWTRPESLSATAFGQADGTERLNYLGALLDAWSLEQNVKWAVNARRQVYSAADPTTPMWHITPGAGVLGVTDAAMAGTVYGRYRNSATGSLATVSVGTAAPEVLVDLTRHGRISTTKATNLVTGILNKSGARTGWTNGLTLTPHQIQTAGGVPANLASVQAGQMARIMGLRDERGVAATTDVIAGETIWDVTANELQFNPAELAARDLASVVEEAGGVLS